MLHERRFFFLDFKAIVFTLSRVYGRSLFTGYLTNVINPTLFFSGCHMHSCCPRHQCSPKKVPQCSRMPGYRRNGGHDDDCEELVACGQ